MEKTKSFSPKLTLVGTAISLAFSGGAFAQYSSAPKKSIETVTVSGESLDGYLDDRPNSHKYAKALVDTPKTISVISQELLRDQNVDNLSDALRNVAGVSTFGAGEGGGGDLTTNDTITIRGFDADSSIYIDDIRDVAGYSRDLFNVEAIEVTKGGNGSITGKGSAGGTLSLITKKANQSKGGFVDLSTSTTDNKRIHVDYNTPLSDRVSARFNVLASEDNDPLGNGVVDYSSYGFAPSFTFDISERTQATLGFLYFSQRNTPSLGLPFVTEAVSASTGLPVGPISEDLWDNYYGVSSRDFEDVDVVMGTFVLGHNFNDNFRIRSATRFASNEKQSITGRPNFLNEGTRAEPDYSNFLVSTALVLPGLAYIDARDEKNQLFVTQLDGIFSLNTGDVKHDIVVGTEYYNDSLTKKDIDGSTVQLSSPGVNLFNPDQNVTFTGAYAPLPAPAETEGSGLAFYALDTVTLNDQWQVSIGARFESYDLDGSQYVTTRVGPDRDRVRQLVSDLESSVDLFSWNAGLVYKPTEASSIYIAAVNSEEPLGGNLRFNGRNEVDLNTNTSIDPEDSTSFELGTKWELFDKSLLLTAAIFQTEKTIIDQAGRGEPIALSGEQTSKGVELAAIGQVSDTLSVSFSYTHLDTEVTETAQDGEPDLGNGLSAAPDDTASLWVNYEPKALDGKLSLGGGVQYSSGDVFFRRNMAFYDTGSYAIWNFVSSYQLSEKVKLQANLNNAFDEKYVTDFSARGHFRPGTPRSGSVSISFDFN